MKRILLATVLAIGLTTAGGFAHADDTAGGSNYGGHGMMMGGGGYGMMNSGYGMGPGMMEDYGFNKGRHHYPGAAGFGRNGWTSEQHQKFMDDTVGLRKEMHDKRFGYMEAVRNPKSTRQQLTMMEKEMIDLRDKIYDKFPQITKAEQKQ